MKSIAIVVAAVLLMVAGPTGAETAPGQMKGGVDYSLPSWFKSRFFHFRDDVEEARKQGRHVMVFLHLDQCLYCARMLRENFIGGESRDFMQKHFDVIGINIHGGAEVTWVDGATYSERALAGQLKAFATPTIVLLDLDGNKLLQLTGYRDPRALRHALEYVQSKSYRRQPFTRTWRPATSRRSIRCATIRSLRPPRTSRATRSRSPSCLRTGNVRSAHASTTRR